MTMQNRRNYLVVIIGLLIFLFLWLKTGEIDFQQHDRFNTNLRRMKELDANINQNIFELRYGLLTYYDPIVNQINELTTIEQKLQHTPSFIDPNGQVEIHQLLTDCIKLQQRKDDLIEKFKSRNAVLKNSLYYLPILITDLTQKITLKNRNLADDLNEILQDVLIYNLTASEDLAPKIREELNALAENKYEDKPVINPVDLDTVIIHIKVILTHKPQVDNLLENLVSLPTWEHNEILYKAYNDNYEKALKNNGFYRLLLYLFDIIVIVSIAAYIIMRLRKAAELVSAAKEKLQVSLAATKLAEEKYRSIFENSTEGIFQTTPTGEFISANPTLARLFGYRSLTEMVTKLTDLNQQLYVIPHRRDQFIAESNKHNVVSQFESQVYRQDGSIVWISENSRTVRDPDGKILYYEGTVEDITSRKQAEIALEKSLALLQATFESTADGILAVDINGKVINLNNKFLEMWDISKDLLLLFSPQEQLRFFAKRLKDPETALNLLKQIYNQPDLEVNDLIELQDGRIFEHYSLPERMGETIVGRVWSFRDITERKRAEAALRYEQEQSERLLLNILPAAIAQRLKLEHTIADSFAEVTVLFADIVGFTQLSAQIPPTELVGLLNEIFSRFDQLTEQHQLEKIKTIGDAYMVVGGLPTPRIDHAVAIAEMALDIQADINQFNLETGKSLRIRIGINTGPVVAGVIGLKKFIYDLWGDTVNTASRMESQGITDTIQVTDVTYQILKDKYLFKQRGLLEVKGKGKMMTYLLTGKISTPFSEKI